MFDKLGEVEKKYESVCHQLQNPDVAGDQKKFRQLMKEQADLEKVVEMIGPAPNFEMIVVIGDAV